MLAWYPGSKGEGKNRAWYTLLAHALNYNVRYRATVTNDVERERERDGRVAHDIQKYCNVGHFSICIMCKCLPWLLIADLKDLFLRLRTRLSISETRGDATITILVFLPSKLVVTEIRRFSCRSTMHIICSALQMGSRLS